MKNRIFILFLLFGLNLWAGLVNDGVMEYNKGNKQKAGELFDKACRGGDMEGCIRLGYMYDFGDGVKQDKLRAKELYRKACSGGHMRGCSN